MVRELFLATVFQGVASVFLLLNREDTSIFVFCFAPLGVRGAVSAASAFGVTCPTMLTSTFAWISRSLPRQAEGLGCGEVPQHQPHRKRCRVLLHDQLLPEARNVGGRLRW